MNYLVMLVVVLAMPVSALAAEATSDGPVKVFILAGQSNMAGWGLNQSEGDHQRDEGTLDHLLSNDPDGDYQFLSNGAGGYAVFEDVWITYNGNRGDLSPGWEGRNGFGPELGFGYAVGKLFSDQVLIIKVARGGKSLGHDFLPPSVEAYPTPAIDGDKGYWYHKILDDVEDVTGKLESYFPDAVGLGFEIVGFGWHQGYSDRVTPEMSAAYESNMTHFINDIRADLKVPNLPIVIATTGMDGGQFYTEVERAQAAMADPARYPEFAGNVAVVDTREPYMQYDRELEFWQRISDSPMEMSHHWNRNAKSYINIGLAMADALTTMAKPKCPYRLRAEASTNGVSLSWLNGTKLPASVRVVRDGVELAAAAPADPPQFEDTTIEPAQVAYELHFTAPDGECEPLTLNYNANITNLTAYRAPTGLMLHWQNNMAYTRIKITRNGEVLSDNVAGSEISYLDTTLPRSGLVTYQVEPTDGRAPMPAQLTINIDDLDSAIVYEPFDDLDHSLNDNSAGIGSADRWVARSNMGMETESLSFGSLPISGGHPYRIADGKVFASVRLSKKVLNTARLLTDGAELWLSFLCFYASGSNTDIEMALCSAELDYHAGVGDGGSGMGVMLDGKKPVAATWSPTRRAHSSSGELDPDSVTMVVAKISWAANPAEQDTIDIYLPADDLVLPAASVSSGSSVIDQSTLDTLTFTAAGGSDLPKIDEIRIGSSYKQVIGDPTGMFLSKARTIRISNQGGLYVHEIDPVEGVYRQEAAYGIFEELNAAIDYSITALRAVAD